VSAAAVLTAIADAQECPTCDGAGEVATTSLSYWGVPDTEACGTCAGTGVIPGDALVCEACSSVFPADDQVCDHGMTLCGDDRGECQVCASEMNYYRGCDDTWGAA
jgi:hypothetical protein